MSKPEESETNFDLLPTANSGYGSDYYSNSHYDCGCPLVFHPLLFAAVMGAIVGSTAFFNVLITMNITGRRKRKKRNVIKSR